MKMERLTKEDGTIEDLKHGKEEVILSDFGEGFDHKQHYFNVVPRKGADGNLYIDYASIQVRSKKKVDEDDEEEEIQISKAEEEFGKMRPLLENGSKKFSKVFQTEKPEFSKKLYGAYWLEITYSLEMNTGIIQHRKANGAVSRVSTVKDWQDFLDVSKPVAIAFRKECEAKGYLGQTPNGKWWCVHPKMCWNGNQIPVNIWQLWIDDTEKVESSPISKWKTK